MSPLAGACLFVAIAATLAVVAVVVHLGAPSLPRPRGRREGDRWSR